VTLVRRALAEVCTAQCFQFLRGVHQGCVVVPLVFLATTDWLLHFTDHRSFVDTVLGSTGLDFADDVALPTVLLLALRSWTRKPNLLAL